MPARPITRPAPALLAALLLAFALAPATSRAAGTPPPKSNPSGSAEELPEAPDTSGTAASASQARADAEKQYRDGYSLAEDANHDLAASKEKDAQKKFGKALKKFQHAADLDPKYYEAWNMVGYCSRQTGDLKRAFAAYDKCLEIKPDYEEAHEYLGEAYLKMGDLAKAKEQLAWLKSRGSKEAGELSEKIAQAEGKAPASPASAGSWGEPAPAAASAAQGSAAPGGATTDSTAAH
jgi:tetratricopeptide (TPR) repeat protein